MASKHLKNKNNNNNQDHPLRPQLVSILVFASIVTHLLPLTVSAASSGSSSQQASNSEATSSSQPLWSYQVKPNAGYGGGLLGNGVGTGGPSNGGQSAHYTGAGPSLFDAFSGLSQRQGALTGSPLMSILPIILIAAGGLLLLLPMFTMMLASPFGGLGGQFGAGAGGYQNFGYPQMARKRSLEGSAGQRQGMLEMIEHISTTIEELGKKYSQAPTGGGSQINNSQPQQPNKRAKSMNSQPQQQVNDLSQSSASINQLQATPVNHKPLEEAILASGSNNNNNNNMPASL